MGKKLTVNVFLPDPDEAVGSLVSFKAGEELPAWAEKLVGDHVFADQSKPEKTSPRGKIPSAKKESPAPVEHKIPSPKEGIAKWKSFAKNAAGIDDLPQSITREEIIERVREVMPDLEISEGE